MVSSKAFSYPVVSPRSEIESLGDLLVQLYRDAGGIDVRPFEESELEVVVERLIPQVRALMERGLGLLEALAESHTGHLRETPDPFSGQRFLEQVDNLMAASDRGRLRDLAFLARFELEGEMRHLRGLCSLGERAELVTCSHSSLRKLRKIATALENAWCEMAGREPELSYVDELQKALEVRRAYAKFRLAVDSAYPPNRDDLKQRLRTAATAIARLGGRDAYWHLRYSDRQQIRQLQQRLLSWMTEPSATADGGLHLWQDLDGFVHLLDAINSRTELADYDRQLVEEARAELFENSETDPPTDGKIPSPWRERLATLLGRDRRIDRTLVSDEAWNLELWRSHLERLLSVLPPS